jgi:ankyrin repeat protein
MILRLFSFLIIFLANSYGNTSLHEAIRENSIELCEILLANGADVNFPNHKGSTPLHFLCYQTHEHRQDDVALLRFLMKNGSDIHRRDNRGMTPFLVCCSSGRFDLSIHIAPNNFIDWTLLIFFLKKVLIQLWWITITIMLIKLPNSSIMLM